MLFVGRGYHALDDPDSVGTRGKHVRPGDNESAKVVMLMIVAANTGESRIRNVPGMKFYPRGSFAHIIYSKTS